MTTPKGGSLKKNLCRKASIKGSHFEEFRHLPAVVGMSTLAECGRELFPLTGAVTLKKNVYRKASVRGSHLEEKPFAESFCWRNHGGGIGRRER